MKQALSTIILVLCSSFLLAQTPTQTIRGTVFDQDNQLPLIGATITILQSNPLLGTTTNTSGQFRFESVPIGRVSLQISYIGYQERIIPNIELNSAKEVILDIGLVESVVKMEEVVITASEKKGKALNDMAMVSSRSISPEQTSRYAGGFNDPSKITSNFAGVSNTQDGGNDIIVRGNSPKYIQWRLEGADISNPNHFGDQNAISGIVGALNNNLLATSDFYTGAFPAEFGNALSGVYDIRMRKGNNEKFEGIFGLGILGTDITLEGPFKKDYQGSYLVNFRYSTIGLVNELGLVEVDGANLHFQDAAFKFWLPTKKLGSFSFFGLQGSSNFLFEEVDPSIWVTPGDDFAQSNITEDYEKRANLLHTGMNHTISLSANSYLRTTFSYSQEGIKDEVFENRLQQEETINQQLNFQTDLLKSAYRINSVYNHKINARHKLNVGLHYALMRQDMQQSMLNADDNRFDLVNFDENINLIRSFVNWKFTPNERLSIVAGLHNTNVLFNEKHTIEPRLALNYGLTPSSTLSFGYGNHSKMESIHNYFAKVQQTDGSFTMPNLDLGLLKANHYVVGYETYFTPYLRLKADLYYQNLYDIPVENDPESAYSTLNEDLNLNYVDLVNEGTAQNYGLELTLEQFLNDGCYFMFNASLFESKYTALDGIERNTQFNSNYLINLLIGKEFSGLGRKNNQVFSINAKAFFGGGRYYIPLRRNENGELDVDPENGLIYDYSKAYENKLDDFVNVVLSLSYKWNKSNTTHELFLNIDNITNNRARMMEYYDPSEENGIGYERQVGIIPNFLYRFYF
ncbi:MAG: TonB-dependent receptor [Saprospiraceae bacterium]|nr:TonB-dependent receptor [Saprospiraceae bacterium]